MRKRRKRNLPLLVWEVNESKRGADPPKGGGLNGSISEREKLDIKRSEVIRGEWKPKKIQISFDKFKEEYLELTRGDKEPKSSLRDECSLKHLSKTFDGKMLSEINPLLIEKYKKTRKEEAAEPATINRELG